MEFLKKILYINFVSILLFISCSDPSENIIESTIDLMGKKYGPGYALTNGMEGRSNWSFFGDNLEVKYSASNKFTGKLHNATEVYKLTNFRRNVSFDDKSEIPATWEVWADWGNHKYNMELKHYSKYEYNDFFDDEKFSKKDQWALIHFVRWGNAWAKTMNYVSEEDAQRLLEIFKVDPSDEEYKITFQKNQEKIEEEKIEKKELRLSSISDYYKEPIINRLLEKEPIKILTEENYLLIDDVENDIEFVINNKSIGLKEFWNNLLSYTEQEFKKISFDDYSRIFPVERGDTYVVRKMIDNSSVRLERQNQIIFYKVDGKLKFKFLVNYGSKSEYFKQEGEYREVEYYREVNKKNLNTFHKNNSPNDYKVSGLKEKYNERFIPSGDLPIKKLRLKLYRMIFVFLNQNISNMDIKGVDLNTKVLVFPLFEDNVDVIEDEYVEKLFQQMIIDNQKKDN